jgi:hypothetical protein
VSAVAAVAEPTPTSIGSLSHFPAEEELEREEDGSRSEREGII